MQILGSYFSNLRLIANCHLFLPSEKGSTLKVMYLLTGGVHPFSEGTLDGWMDGYFVYRRSTLKGHIASNKFCYMMILFNEKFKNI